MQRLPFISATTSRICRSIRSPSSGWTCASTISSSAISCAFAKGMVTRAEALHICYCHTPMRWAWSYRGLRRARAAGPISRAILARPSSPGCASGTIRPPRESITSSPTRRTVAARIAKYYRREATVICRPGGYLALYGRHHARTTISSIVSRLIPYKRIDLAVAGVYHGWACRCG